MGGTLSQAFESVRNATGFRSFEDAKAELSQALDAAGFATTRSMFVSVVTQLVRAGTSEQTDRFLWLANALWRRAERRLGVAIDARVFAYCLVSRPSVDRRLREFLVNLSGGDDATAGQVFLMAERMLLRSCEDSCSECLDQPARYSDLRQPSRSLARLWLDMTVSDVEWHPDLALWLPPLQAALRDTGSARLVVPTQMLTVVARSLPQVLAERMEAHFLLLPVMLQRIDRAGPRTYLTFRTSEAIHA